MKTLTLRIYLTVVSVLLLFAFGSGWLYQHHIQQERAQINSAVSERMAALGDLIQNSLPGGDAPPTDQGEALRDWSQRLRLPMALDDQRGNRIAASESFIRRSSDSPAKILPIRLEDGRTLWVVRSEINANVAELDALVEDVLLASRLDGCKKCRPP